MEPFCQTLPKWLAGQQNGSQGICVSHIQSTCSPRPVCTSFIVCFTFSCCCASCCVSGSGAGGSSKVGRKGALAHTALHTNTHQARERVSRAVFASRLSKQDLFIYLMRVRSITNQLVPVKVTLAFILDFYDLCASSWRGSWHS